MLLVRSLSVRQFLADFVAKVLEGFSDRRRSDNVSKMIHRGTGCGDCDSGSNPNLDWKSIPWTVHWTRAGAGRLLQQNRHTTEDNGSAAIPSGYRGTWSADRVSLPCPPLTR